MENCTLFFEGSSNDHASHIETSSPGDMDALSYSASWRAFLSGVISPFFSLVFLFCLGWAITGFAARFLSSRTLFLDECFRPPECARDAFRIFLALFRALFSGVIHTKVFSSSASF